MPRSGREWARQLAVFAQVVDYGMIMFSVSVSILFFFSLLVYLHLPRLPAR